MMQADRYTDTAIGFDHVGPAALKKKWVEMPAETTAIDLDGIVEHKSEFDTSKQSNSLSSPWMADTDVVKNIYRAGLDYYQNPVNEIWQTIDHTALTLPFVSMDLSTPIPDYHSSYVEAKSVKNEIERLFSLATFIDLEPGMSNSFSEGLEYIVEQQGNQALDAIKRIILDEETASSIALEALKYVGNMDSPRWHEERRLMLEECLLNSRSAWVKDGAGLGLSFLDNPRSIPAIERAITKESSKALKEDLKLVLNQLTLTLGA